MTKKASIAKVTIEIVMNDDVPLEIRTAWAAIVPDALGNLANKFGAHCTIAMGVNEEEGEAIQARLNKEGQDFEVVSREELDAINDSHSSTSH